MEPVRVSVSNTRPRLNSAASRGTVKKRTSAPGFRAVIRGRTPPVAECRAMTSMPRRVRRPPQRCRCSSSSPSRRPAARPRRPRRRPPRRRRPSARRAPSSGTERLARPAVSCDATASPPPVAQASPDPASDPNAALYTSIEGQVSAIRGLPLKTPVERATSSTDAQLCTFFAEDVLAGQPARVAGQGQRGSCYKGLLLMPEDAVADATCTGDAHEPGRGPVRRPDEEDVRRLRHRRDRPDSRRSRTPTSTRMRCRTRRSRFAR